MNMYSCDVCNCTFTRKQNYDCHMRTKKHMTRYHSHTSKHLHKCNRCNKSFTFSQALYKHKKTCEVSEEDSTQTKGYEQMVVQQQQQINVLQQQINYLLVSSTSAPSQAIVPVQPQSQQLQPLQSQSEPLPPSQPQTINNNQSQNTINSHNKNTTNNNININIQSFGNENLDYLNDSTIEGCINRVYDSIPRLIKTIHFHPKHPENHNIKVTNKKLPHATYLDDDKEWKLMNKDDAIHTMVETGYSILDSKFKEDPSKFTEERRRHYRRFQENYDNEDKATMKRIKNDVEMVLYNGTKEIMKKS